jgi:hypothetical protein
VFTLDPPEDVQFAFNLKQMVPHCKVALDTVPSLSAIRYRLVPARSFHFYIQIASSVKNSVTPCKAGKNSELINVLLILFAHCTFWFDLIYQGFRGSVLAKFLLSCVFA